MTKIRLDCTALLLVIGLVSILAFLPMQLNAQIGGITLGNKFENDPNDDERVCSSTERTKSIKFCNYYAAYRSAIGVDNVKAAEIRNLMIDALKVSIDDYYNDHKGGRVAKTKWFQTVLDILGIGLAFSGNVVGGVRSKTVLAATSGAFQAGRNSVNDRFHLLQQQILINKMNSNRLDQWAIIVKRKKDSIGDFSWDNAKGELQQYLFRGSFTDALDSLVEQTGAQVQESQVTLKKALIANTKASLANGVQNFTGYIVPMNTQAIKLDAEIAAADELIPTNLPDPLNPEIIAAQEKKIALEARKMNLLENYKNIWTAIKASGDFDVIDGLISDKFGPKALIEYNRVKKTYDSPANTLTADDYDKALTKVNVIVKDYDEMNRRFLAILDKYRL